MKIDRHIGMVFLLLVLLAGCRTGNNQDRKVKVIFSGHPQEVLAGNFDQKIDIDSLVGRKNSYAFGVLDSLAGVLQIFDGSAFVSRVEGDSVIMSSKLVAPAILVTSCENADWRQIALPPSVANIEALVGFFQYHESPDLDTRSPFIFLIEGVVEQLDWHIVPDTQRQTDPLIGDRPTESGRGTFTDKYVEVVGVYYTGNNHGFMPDNLPVHMHFKTADGNLAGHVDLLEFGPEMSLRIPKTD